MAELLTYKCPSCGGDVEFDARSQNMKCPYCDTEFDPETLRQYEEGKSGSEVDKCVWESTEEAIDEDEAVGFSVYTCRSCGGEVVAEDTQASLSCPFCGGPIVISEKLSGALKPDYVIPFKLTKDDAKNALREFYKGKRLLPKLFSRENHIDEIKGMYVPFWMYSCNSTGSARYRATRVRAWSDSRYNYTETTHYAVSRRGNADFTGVPVDGSSKMPNEIMESIEPFNLNEAVDFKTAYLSGYLADKYDVDSVECKSRADQRIKHTMDELLRSTVRGYASVVPEMSTIHYGKAEVKYGLLPVWMLTTKWKDSTYIFAMNGQTGKLVGDLPCDMGLFWKYFAIFFAAITAVAFGISFLL